MGHVYECSCAIFLPVALKSIWLNAIFIKPCTMTGHPNSEVVLYSSKSMYHVKEYGAHCNKGLNVSKFLKTGQWCTTQQTITGPCTVVLNI